STAVEMLGQPAATLLNDSDAPAESSLSDLIRRAIEEGEPQRAEFDLRGGKRTYFPARVVAVPVREENEITGAVVVFEDVTEHRRSEGALRRSETNYRALVDNAAYGIYRSSLEGKLLSVNPALVEMLGYDSAAELMAVDMARDLYTDSTERQRLIETLGQEELSRVETTWRKKDGKTIAVTLSNHRIVDEAGAIVGYEGIVEDVTERRQLEAQLRQAQKLEAVGQLTGGIAHDFNNVLTVIIANAELAKSSGLDHAELLDYVQEIERAAHGASTTVKRLLGFGRKADLNMVPANLTEIVNNLSPMLRTVTPESIELSIDGDDAVASAKADAGAVEQMIINLVNNAKDAMPKGGSLRVEVANAELDERHREFWPWIVPGRCVCISVSDTGEGMDEETKNRIFEPFYTTKPVGVGTGLGMAMVYGLMKQHGGFVHVDSEVSHGTTVKLYFPAVREAARRSTIKTPLPEEILHGSETILLVEDQDDVRRTGRRVLQRFGYNVLVAVNGEEALEIYHAHDGIDLIVSDLVMPKMGGRELYQALSQENPAVKFILSSGYREQDAIQRAEMTDELPFLEKPWSVPELVGKVREVLDADDPASVGETED
ncbi:MAG: PAS domain S-box protein, partial [Gemmatimonadales bacterium]